jgi:hypothetical protein
MKRARRGLITVFWALGLIALLAVGGYSAYFAFSTRLNGGSSFTGFQVTLTRPPVHVSVPKGDVLVVIPDGIQNNPASGFQPPNVKVELGVNNTILFANEDNNIHIVQSFAWPAGIIGFDVWLTPGATGTLRMNVTGTYVYNFELVKAAHNGTITVVS